MTWKLMAAVRQRGYAQVLVETTATWASMVQLCRACGFVAYVWRDGDVHLRWVVR
jgi:hypothetical protein